MKGGESAATGTVKWFDAEKRYGFIDQDSDVVHQHPRLEPPDRHTPLDQPLKVQAQAPRKTGSRSAVGARVSARK
ncbi:cold shock domain-containing protein [Streptomyces sp. NBC_00654]|uniref:cold shock domain-containing protein n=1 Tax=Streptomyces sp. NBC_00654 TaxID=2975799 RepID=UPI0033905CD3